MAKSSWLTVSPMSGSGNATLTNTGTNHTGRNTRSTSVTATVRGLSDSRSYTVVQKALAEFVSIVGDASVTVDKEGQTLTLSGVSNSSKLKFSIRSSAVIIPTSYTANGTTVVNGTAIAGDPGASAQYEFSISVVVSENPTSSARSLIITVTTESGAEATWTLNQAASDIVHTLTLSPSVSMIAAKGGSSIISSTLRTYRNGSLISIDNGNPTCTVSGSEFSVSSENVISVGTRGITVGDVRSTTVTGSYRGITATVIVSQEANKVESSVDSGGEVTYGSVTIGTITNATIAASGGTGTATAGKGSQSKTVAATYRTDTYTSEATDMVQTAAAVTTNESIDPSVSSISGTAPSKGTTVSEITTVKSQAVTWTGNGGKSASGTMYVYQEANEAISIIYGTPTVTLTVSDIPASGGKVSSGTVLYSQSRTQNYTSGDTSVLSALTSGGSVLYGTAVEASSLGTIVKGRTSVGTLTATVTMNGKSGSGSATVYQQANFATYGGVSVTATTPVSIPASGGSSTISPTASQTVSFTSGDTRAGSVSFDYEIKTSKTGFSLSGATVTVTQNTSTSPRNGFVVTVTATGEMLKSATTDVTFNQAGASVVLPSWDAQSDYNFDVNPQDGVQINISDPNNRGWEIRGNSNEFIVVDQTPYRLDTPYSGTGSVSFEFYLDPNVDSSAITNTVYLYSGSTLCGSFSYVQGSGASLDVTPTELSFVANGEGKTITITSNGDWTIS